MSEMRSNLKGKTVYIGNLNYKFDEKSIFRLFGKFGKVGQINIVRVPGTDKSKGIAFVDMVNSREADKAIKLLNGTVVGGRTIKVSEAIESDSLVKRTLVSKDQKREKKEELVLKKKSRRRKSLDILFEKIGKK